MAFLQMSKLKHSGAITCPRLQLGSSGTQAFLNPKGKLFPGHDTFQDIYLTMHKLNAYSDLLPSI